MFAYVHIQVLRSSICCFRYGSLTCVLNLFKVNLTPLAYRFYLLYTPYFGVYVSMKRQYRQKLESFCLFIVAHFFYLILFVFFLFLWFYSA